MSTGLPLFDFAETSQPSCTVAAPPAHVPRSRPADDLPAEVIKIIIFLKNCFGAAAGKKAADIAEGTGILPGRSRQRRGDHVRALISDHIFSFPFVVVADPHHGYYRPSTPVELEKADRSLMDRHTQIGRRRKAVIQTAQAEGWYRDSSGHWHRPGS